MQNSRIQFYQACMHLAAFLLCLANTHAVQDGAFRDLGYDPVDGFETGQYGGTPGGDTHVADIPGANQRLDIPADAQQLPGEHILGTVRRVVDGAGQDGGEPGDGIGQGVDVGGQLSGQVAAVGESEPRVAADQRGGDPAEETAHSRDDLHFFILLFFIIVCAPGSALVAAIMICGQQVDIQRRIAIMDHSLKTMCIRLEQANANVVERVRVRRIIPAQYWPGDPADAPYPVVNISTNSATGNSQTEQNPMSDKQED